MLTMAYAEMHTATFHINVLCFCDVSTSVGRFFRIYTYPNGCQEPYNDKNADTCTACAARFKINIEYALFIHIRICFRGTS